MDRGGMDEIHDPEKNLFSTAHTYECVSVRDVYELGDNSDRTPVQ